MAMLRATTVRAMLGAVLLAAAASSASAQSTIDFPTRPVKILVPFAAGGPTDVVARILADLLSARWNGQSVVIENRPGAGTIVATAAVGKSPADGYTMLIGTNSFLINPAIGQKLPYDTLKEFVGISMIATQPVALVATKSFPVETVADLVALAKRSAEPLNFTSPGPRGVGHLAGEMLKQRAGPDRRDRRAGADHVRRLALGQALCRGRRSKADRRRGRRAAERRAERADAGGKLSGLQRRRNQRHVRARGHPGAGAGEALRR